jgi:short-subunit dehydrogenase
VTARRKDKLEELAKTINGGAGGKALAVSGDAAIMTSMTLLSFHGLQGP